MKNHYDHYSKITKAYPGFPITSNMENFYNNN